MRPPSTMFAISGGPLGKARAMAASCVLAARRLDEQNIGAGFVIGARARDGASKPSTAAASVRAMISVSRCARASIAALILPTISAVAITRLVAEMAAALREGLVFELDRVGAGALQQPNRALRVERVAVAGVGVDDKRRRDAVADEAQRIRDFATASRARCRAGRAAYRRGSRRRDKAPRSPPPPRAKPSVRHRRPPRARSALRDNAAFREATHISRLVFAFE